LKNQDLTWQLRCKMIDWMIEVTSSYKCQDQTLFLSVLLMDQFYASAGQNLPLGLLHQIGITCMFIAAKYNEIYPIRIHIFYEKIAYFKVSVQQIKA
jgi:hypothetical protein